MKEASYKRHLLFVLVLILAFNNVDRLALGLVLQDIKLEFNLSDTQLGLLTGIAFALFYSVMGVPIGRWADRGNRVTIVAITTALWSAAVALCAAAGNFLQLLLVRVGVAVGEAGCLPPAHSLIADHFSRLERPRAVSRYMLGAPLGVVIGYFIAGWLNEFFGWRMTFVLLGVPGLILAALAWWTLHEPRLARSSDDRPVQSDSALEPRAANLSPSLAQVCRTLWASRTFRHLLLCFSVASFFGSGIGQWQPAFFVRTYGLQSGELGTWFTCVYGLGGLVGMYWGGELASRRARNNEPLQLKAMAGVYASFGLVSGLTYLSPNHYIAFSLMGLAAIGSATTAGPLFATIQTVVPERMRATAIALIYLFSNLIGMGLGPLAVGALSDRLRPFVGEESLRYALLLLCPGYFWAAWHFLRASKTVAHDLTALQSHSSSLEVGAPLGQPSPCGHSQGN